MSETNYLWHPAYRAAACETDDSLMPGRILEAVAAIEQRLLTPAEIDDEELRALKNAQAALQSLRAERVNKRRPDADSRSEGMLA
jgi:hypothetical protein